MTTLTADTDRIEMVRFRDDNPEMFGVEIGDGPCDETYARGLREHLSHAVEVVPGPTAAVSVARFHSGT